MLPCRGAGSEPRHLPACAPRGRAERLPPAPAPRGPLSPLGRRAGRPAAAMAVIGLAALSAVLSVLARARDVLGGRRRDSPGRRAKREVPADYLSLYRQAADKTGVPWSVLAAIGSIESDHGRSRAPGV